MRVDEMIVDVLQRDQDVLHWLQQARLFAANWTARNADLFIRFRANPA